MEAHAGRSKVTRSDGRKSEASPSHFELGHRKSFEGGRGFVEQLIALVRSCGGFRVDSPNYVGEDAIRGLREAWPQRDLFWRPMVSYGHRFSDTLRGAELTIALDAYVRRAQKGAEDAALLAGTSKDL